MPPKKDTRSPAAIRAQRYRDRKKAELAAALITPGDVRDAPRDERPASPPPKPFKMVDSVSRAIASMKWLQESDNALVDMAKLYAVQIDYVLEQDPSATGKAASLGQLLTRILHELGGTPTVRMQHELRSMRLGAGADPMAGDDDAGSEDTVDPRGSRTERKGATVTSIKRPAKRRRA